MSDANLILGQSNADYHGNTSHLSSSALKLLLKDPADFERQYILGIKENSDSEVFTEGSLTHTLILEPEKLQIDYAVYPGLRRAGSAFEEFKQTANGRKIVTAAMLMRCQKLATAHSGHKTAMELMANGLPEHNMIAEIQGVPVKARTDFIAPERGVIVDVKTTSMPSGVEFFKDTVKQYDYDLSSALYCDIAEATYGKPFDFYWEVLSKSDGGVELYKMSEATRGLGKAKVTRAITVYKQCKETGIWTNELMKKNYDTDNYEIVEV